MKNLIKTHRYSLWLAAVMGVFVFNSCTEDAAMDDNMNAIQESEQQRLSLVSRTGDPIIINDLSENDISVARATGAAGNDRGRFNITLKFLLPPTERQAEVFDQAAARWERIIIKDILPFFYYLFILYNLIFIFYRSFPLSVNSQWSYKSIISSRYHG